MLLIPIVQSNIETKICSLINPKLKISSEVTRIMTQLKNDLKLSLEMKGMSTENV